MSRRYLFLWVLVVLIGGLMAGCGTEVDEMQSPGTLIASLAPSVSPGSPDASATDVRIDTTISVVFSKNMDPATVTTLTFLVEETVSGAAVTGTVNFSGGVTAIFTPSANLTNGLSYTVTITQGAMDLSGTPLGSETSWTFTTTSDVTGPIFLTGTPTGAAEPIQTAATAQFDEALDCSAVSPLWMTLSETISGFAVSGLVTCSNDTLTFTPTSNLTNGVDYTVTVTNNVEDAYGNAMTTGPNSWTFTTSP